MRQTHLARAFLIVTLSLPAMAWTQGNPGATGWVPGDGGPAFSPPDPPPMPGYPGGWSRYNAPGAPNVAWPAHPAHPAGQRPHLRISRGMDGAAYLIDVALQNIDPKQVQIRPAGRGIFVSYRHEAQLNRRDTLPGGDGYRRSYSVSRGSANNRIGLPPDADLGAMSTEVKDGHILVRVPRVSEQAFGRWSSPAWR